MQFQMNGSLFLIGAALALAGIIGVLQPPGHRGGALLALLAGIGVGIAGLALRLTALETGREDVFWSTFFACSIAGFVTVVAMLSFAWRRARPRSEPLR
jgi:drug/metabolite transporter (DMT)-like permease